MSDDIDPTPPAGSNPTHRLDRGQRIAIGIMGGLVVLGGLAAILSPRHPSSPPSTEPTVMATNAVFTPSSTTPEPKEAERAVLPTVVIPVIAVGPDASVTTEGAEPRLPKAWRVASMKGEANIDVIEGMLGSRTLSVALTQAGVPKAEIKRLLHAFEGIHRIERVEHAERAGHASHPKRDASPKPTAKPKQDHAPKESFVVARERPKGTVVAFEFIASPVDIWQAKTVEDATGKHLVVSKLDLHVEQRKIGSVLTLSADLGKAVAAAGLHQGAIEAIDDALEGFVDLTALKPGVHIRVVGTEDWVDGTFARYRVGAIEFVPRSGAPLRIYGYDKERNQSHPAHLAFYDAKGREPYRGTFRSPLPFTRITSRYNPKRMHPVLHTVLPHNGVDFRAPIGTPVFAAGAGSVASVGDGGRCGNMIQIDHKNGMTTGYCHLSRFAAGLHIGQHVESRQLIGYVGKTGSATGPHLHFSVKRGGVFIDPLALKMDGMRVLPLRDRNAFAAARADLDKAIDAIALPNAAPDNDQDEHDEHDDHDELAGEE